MTDTVRQPSSEPADPFGDAPWTPPPPRSSAPPLAPAPSVPLGFEPEPSSQPLPADFGSPAPSAARGFGALAASGIARVIASVVVIGIFSGGWGLFTDLSNPGPPNVPAHILEECRDARIAAGPPGVAVGTHYAYEQAAGGSQTISFRTLGGEEWDCRRDGFGTTSVGAVRQP